MSKYKKLLNNTLYFFVGNMGSKLLIFFLVPYYTYVLSTAEYGTADLITTTASLIIPVVTLSITEAVFRFSMDEKADYKALFSNGLLIVCIGGVISFVATKTLSDKNIAGGVQNLCWILIVAESLYNLAAQFIRGIGKTRLYAVGGFIQTLILVILNIAFLLKLKLGISGYILAMVISYACVFQVYVIAGKIYRYVGRWNWPLLRKMLRYSLPMIPNGLSWWAMSYADKYVILVFLGAAANGVYLVAQKIPTILTMFTTIFHQAWQISAVEEGSNEGKSDFSMSVYDNLQAVMFICTSLIIAMVKLLYAVWVSNDYFEAWETTPMLLLATVFSCLSQFLTVNYMVDKKTMGSLKVTLVGCAVNITLNMLLIPHFGITAAATATFVGYLSTYVVTIFDLKMIDCISIKKISGSVLTCILQMIFLKMPTMYMILVEIVCMIVQMAIYKSELRNMQKYGRKICDSVRRKICQK